MSKKLSIAVPTYNRLAYLKQSLQSILDQTFQDFSIFVFDNASTEPVKEEIEKFGDPRIQFIGAEKNIGSPGNINRILQYPFESEYLIIFHDDDVMHPKMLEIETSFLDAHKDLVFVVSDLKRSQDSTMQSFSSFNETNIPHIIYRNNPEFARAQMSWLRYAFDSAMYRVEALKNTQMKPERFSDFADMVFLAEISKKGPCAFLNAPLVNYRVHVTQDSGLLKEDYADGAFKTLSFFRESLPDVLSKEDYKLFHAYSLNFLLRSYANINKGFLNFVRFFKKAQQQKLIRYRDFRYIDAHGVVSAISILFHSRKIIDAARWLRNLFQ